MINIKNKKCSILFPVNLKEDVIPELEEKIKSSELMNTTKQINEFYFDISRVTKIDFFGFQYVFLLSRYFKSNYSGTNNTFEKSEAVKTFEEQVGIELN